MNIINRKLLVIAFLIVLISLASAKSYYLPKAEVYMKINPDGLIEEAGVVEVVEEQDRTYI